ncbi:MAG: phosphatase, partial [Erysipelotrichaceae bacterium]|nr:phosphatase [Erysipelotrichaceae bacterium]
EGKEKNTLNIISCMAHPKVKLISHPDDDHTPLDYQMLVKAAKTTSTALEVNSSSLRKKQFRINCEENYRVMLKLCEEYEVPIIVSSDAHDPSQVADFDEAQKLINECGFSEELILNNDKDKLFRFLFN